VQSSNDGVQCDWSGFTEDVSEIAEYEISVSFANSSQLVPFESAGVATTATVSFPPQAAGTKLLIVLRARNLAGLATEVSTAVQIDNTPPLPGQLSVMQSNASDLLTISWSAFHDAESAIGDYSWCIQSSAASSCDLLPLQSVGLLRSASAQLSALPSSFVVFVQATNEAQLVASEQLTANTQPPIVQGLIDGSSGGDAQFQSSSRQLSARWQLAFSSSSLARCEAAFGTSRGGSQLLPFTDVQLSTSLTTLLPANRALQPEQMVFATVRCFDETGLLGIASSDGVLFDATPPLLGSLTIAFGQGFTSDASGLSFTWSGFSDPESGVWLVAFSMLFAQSSILLQAWHISTRALAAKPVSAI